MEINCPNCSKSFNSTNRKPVNLYCQHNLCNICYLPSNQIERIQEKRCPKCQKKYEVDYQNIPYNMLALEVLKN
jgi:DNA polymerase III alpha subunit (gram-positive type)